MHGADARRGGRARSRGGRARGRHRHGAPRPAERPRPHHRAARTRRSCASSRASGRSRRSPRRRRARAATSSTTSAQSAGVARRPGEATVLLAANPSHLEAVDPVVEGITRAEQTDRSLARRRTRPGRRAAHPHPRRRLVPGTGRRRRDAEPPAPHRLHDRRHPARDREQPGRVHHRPRRRALDAVLERPREGLRQPDHPRQRRRSRGRDLGDPSCARVPAAIRKRRRRRPRRLPAPRSQRG